MSCMDCLAIVYIFVSCCHVVYYEYNYAFCCMFKNGCMIFTVKVRCAFSYGSSCAPGYGLLYKSGGVLCLILAHCPLFIIACLGIKGVFWPRWSCMRSLVPCMPAFVVVYSRLIGGGTVLSGQRAILSYNMCWCRPSCEPGSMPMVSSVMTSVVMCADLGGRVC